MAPLFFMYQLSKALRLGSLFVSLSGDKIDPLIKAVLLFKFRLIKPNQFKKALKSTLYRSKDLSEIGLVLELLTSPQVKIQDSQVRISYENAQLLIEIFLNSELRTEKNLLRVLVKSEQFLNYRSLCSLFDQLSLMESHKRYDQVGNLLSQHKKTEELNLFPVELLFKYLRVEISLLSKSSDIEGLVTAKYHASDCSLTKAILGLGLIIFHYVSNNDAKIKEFFLERHVQTLQTYDLSGRFLNFYKFLYSLFKYHPVKLAVGANGIFIGDSHILTLRKIHSSVNVRIHFIEGIQLKHLAERDTEGAGYDRRAVLRFVLGIKSDSPLYLSIGEIDLRQADRISVDLWKDRVHKFASFISDVKGNDWTWISPPFPHYCKSSEGRQLRIRYVQEAEQILRNYGVRVVNCLKTTQNISDMIDVFHSSPSALAAACFDDSYQENDLTE
ncbi:hypothetical protein N9Y18_06325 [Litoricolaceae bacterium]|nr:hypothetical protein [Litorivicinaceae bacterium]